MEYWTIPLTIVIGALGIYYLFRKFHYFKRHNIIHMPSFPIFGSMLSVTLRQISFVDFCQKVYTLEPRAKYVGFYTMTQSVILLRDPELIKEIFVKNFEAFPNRVGFSYLKNEPLFSKNLFSLRGQKWRDVRTMLSPAFTSSKMKMMFALMLECAVDLTESLSEKLTGKGDVDMKDVFTKYTNDVIATCAFGIKVNSLKNPTNEFYVYGRYASTLLNSWRGLKMVFFALFPRVTRILGIKFVSDKVERFFKNLIKVTIDTRDKGNITRPDMIQLMMDIRGKRETERELTFEEMTAQAFGFFFGGFETVSTTLSFVAQELAGNPDVQEKLRQEIDKARKDSNGEVSYETINRLEYLEAVINETLRIYPSIIFLERLSVKDYELPPALPGRKPFTLRKGSSVWAPIYSIQHDEKYFDEPEKFRPERFLSNDNVYHNAPYFAPFGLGPRMCIANRFAMMEVKVLLFHLLLLCELRLSSKSIFPVRLTKSAFPLIPEGGFWLSIEHRNDTYPTISSTISDS